MSVRPRPVKYPASKRRPWDVQIEFMDGTTIDATSDEDAIDRWQRLAAWWDESALDDKSAWMEKVLMRARTAYQVVLPGVTASTPPRQYLDALSAEGCLIVRRKG